MRWQRSCVGQHPTLWVAPRHGVWSHHNVGGQVSDLHAGVGGTKSSDHYSVAESLGGGLSATAGNGQIFHFFPDVRTPLDATDIEAVFTTVQARLIVADPAQPADCGQAKFLASVGMDFWPDEVTEVEIAPAAGLGRMKYVTEDWQSFNMVNMPGNDPEYIRANPPPLE